MGRLTRNSFVFIGLYPFTFIMLVLQVNLPASMFQALYDLMQ